MGRWPAADRLVEGRRHRTVARQLRPQQGLGLRRFPDSAGELYLSDVLRERCAVRPVSEGVVVLDSDLDGALVG